MKKEDVFPFPVLTLEEKREQARIEAKSIIERLDPEHIDTWPGLIEILEDALEIAKGKARLMQS